MVSYTSTIKSSNLLKRLNPFPASWQERWRRFSSVNPITGRVLLFIGFTGFILFFFLSIFMALVYAGAFGALPATQDLKNINNNLASQVYFSDGTLLGSYFLENRLPVKLEDIAPCVTQAAIATEDVRFYKHHGIDWRSWGRVAVRTILMQEDQSGGGSTITQQLAKNLYPRKKYRMFSIPVNKAREIVIARRLEKIYSKDEIMALYLNTIPFSGNVFGIRVAAQRFFDTTPKNIKPEEAAVLIGMLKATTAYHPVKNPKRSKERRNTVLARMEKCGFLTKPECDSLKNRSLQIRYRASSNYQGAGSYFLDHIRLELEEALKKYTKPDGSAYNLNTDGLKIYTTLDSKIQKHAEASVVEEMRKIQENYFKHFKGHKGELPYGSEELLRQQIRASERYQRYKEQGLSKQKIDSLFAKKVKMTLLNWQTGGDRDTTLSPLDSIKYYLSILNTGFLAVEPKSGKIKAWVGGVHFKYLKFDHIKSRRSVGSTFKPILYAQALRSGISPCKHFRNEHIVYEEFDNWAPRNIEDDYGGSYNMQGALRKSVNVIAIQVILEIGVDSVRNLARAMGITSPIPKEAGIAIGGVDLSLYEMTNAFATLANEGIRPELHWLTRIETPDGKTIAEIRPPNPKKFQRALSERHAQMITRMLEKVVRNGGTAQRMERQLDVDIDVAGKTGTSNDQKDGWFIGYTPDLAVGAWVGGENPQVRFRDTKLGQGSSTALPICSNFFNRVYQDKAFEKWEEHQFPHLDSLTHAMLACQPRVKIDSTMQDSTGLAPILPETPAAVPVKNEDNEEFDGGGN